MYSVTFLIQHTGGPEKMLEYSGFYFKDKHILRPWKCVD